MSHFMPPALLALFAPRLPLQFKPPIPRRTAMQLTGIGEYADCFLPKSELKPVEIIETAKQRKAKLQAKKMESHQIVLAERAKNWDPKNNPNATSDAYKTLFVARLSYDIDKNDLRDEFERYGPVKQIVLVRNKETKKPRGYAFIEFESSHDLKDAFRRADGRKLKGRRILVDVERGRTVPDWKPRKLGGGLGGTRLGGPDQNRKYSGREETSSRRAGGSERGAGGAGFKERRDRYRDRDFRDKDRRDRRRERSRSRERGAGGGGGGRR